MDDQISKGGEGSRKGSTRSSIKPEEHERESSKLDERESDLIIFENEEIGEEEEGEAFFERKTSKTSAVREVLDTTYSAEFDTRGGVKLKEVVESLKTDYELHKDLYFRPLYDKEPLFTKIKSKRKCKSKMDITIGELREAEFMPSPSVMAHEIHKRKGSAPLGIGDVKQIISSETTSTSTTLSDETDMVQKTIRYLLTLMPGDIEEEGVAVEAPEAPKEAIEEITDEIHETGKTESMRQAQKYLRIHKIFEFLQFLTAHLLSATPENPIDFLIELLDTCLIYRAGFCDPPLLYQRKHLEVLFNLMDRMRTGFIELEQYRTGMVTLGLCSYNPKPPLTIDGMVTKDYFIDEAYDCECKLLDDMIRRRWIRNPPQIFTPPATTTKNRQDSIMPGTTHKTISNVFIRQSLYGRSIIMNTNTQKPPTQDNN